jgi:hypothetical protein
VDFEDQIEFFSKFLVFLTTPNAPGLVEVDALQQIQNGS